MADRQPEAEFTALYRDNYGRVLRFVARRVGSESEAEDVTAETFKIAWDKVLQGTSLSAGWLFVTAQNTLRNHLRSVQRAEQLYRSATADLKARTTAHSPTDVVQATLAELDDQHRAILVLRYWDELSAREIAAVLNVSVSAVWVRMHRARRAFQSSFNATSGDRHGHR